MEERHMKHKWSFNCIGGGPSSSSFTTENLQLDEGYFPLHAWHDNFFY
jgi:hypothetical protein